MGAVNRIIVVLAGLAAAVHLLPSVDLDVTKSSDGQEAMHGPVPLWEAKPSPALLETVVVNVTERPAARPTVHNMPPVPMRRDAIGRQLQKELKRVGCYPGDLDGAWSASTQRAMRDFTNRVNAVLPTAEPDAILLALVQAHPDKVCGVPCPAGQSLSADDQCLPDALLALSGGAKVAVRPTERLSSTITAWTATPTATDEASTVGHVSPTPSATVASATEPPRRHAKAGRAQPRSTERWAQNFFKQLDRLSLN